VKERASDRGLFKILPQHLKGINQASRHEGVLGEWRYISTHSLTSTPDGSVWSASRPGRFAPRERAAGTHWIGGWMGPGPGMDAKANRNPCQESNLGRPASSLVTKLTELAQ